MQIFSRRDFGSLSLAGLSTAALSNPSFAAVTSASPQVPTFRRLSVTCGSRANFTLFRRFSKQVGLAGVVNVVNAGGPFDPGSLFLYPWLKAEGQTLRTSSLKASLPYGPYASQPDDLIPDATLPQDEYICRYKLKLPWRCFIGFTVDVPCVSPLRTAWSSDIPKLTDGGGIAIDWTSSNLNDPWFAGSRFIPETNYAGSTWRALIVAALNEASVGSC